MKSLIYVILVLSFSTVFGVPKISTAIALGSEYNYLMRKSLDSKLLTRMLTRHAATKSSASQHASIAPEIKQAARSVVGIICKNKTIGSGFLVLGKNNKTYIVTAQHVVDTNKHVAIIPPTFCLKDFKTNTFTGTRPIIATCVACKQDADIAILSLIDDNLDRLTELIGDEIAMGDITLINNSELYYGVGYPQEINNLMTEPAIAACIPFTLEQSGLRTCELTAQRALMQLHPVLCTNASHLRFSVPPCDARGISGGPILTNSGKIIAMAIAQEEARDFVWGVSVVELHQVIESICHHEA